MSTRVSNVVLALLLLAPITTQAIVDTLQCTATPGVDPDDWYGYPASYSDSCDYIAIGSGDTQYRWTDLDGKYVRHHLTDLTSITDAFTIDSVVVVYRFRHYDPGGIPIQPFPTLKLWLKVGVDSMYWTNAGSGTYTTYRKGFTTAPGGGAWTVGKVDSLQFFCEYINYRSGHQFYLSEMFVEVYAWDNNAYQSGAGIIVDSVKGASDDCTYLYENATATDSFYLSRSAQNWIGDKGEGDITQGLRFSNVNVAQGTTIDSAWIVITANADDSDGVIYNYIFGEDTANPSAFTDKTDFLARTRTADSIYWQINATDVWRKGYAYRTPDIKTIVQSIVNRTDWSSGNAMVFFFDDYNATASGLIRPFHAYETKYSPSVTAKLVIWTPAPAATSQVIRVMIE